MGEQTAIEWTDATWNPVRGCTRVSSGCGGPGKQGGCYAEQIAARFSRPGQPFHGFAEMKNGEARWTGKLALVEDALTLPLRWRRPRRIFVNSMSDLFHEALPDSAIDRVFAVMALAPQHTFQVLTKRPERMREYFATLARDDRALDGLGRWHAETAPVLGEAVSDERWEEMLSQDLPLPNVWLGTSCEDQATANERIPHLLETPAAVRFVSLEPLLGPIELTRIQIPRTYGSFLFDALAGAGRDHHGAPFKTDLDGQRLNWVITGGESGPRARPAHPDWFRTVRDACAAAGVPYLHKQWGEWRPPLNGEYYNTLRGRAGKPPAFIMEANGNVHCTAFCADMDNPKVVLRIGKKRAGRLLDGVEHSAFPEVRQ